jgi:hypothetical protein
VGVGSALGGAILGVILFRAILGIGMAVLSFSFITISLPTI